MNQKLRSIWKTLIISFFLLALVFLFTPASILTGVLRVIHIGLSITLIGNMAALIIVALAGLYLHRSDLGWIKAFIGFLIIVFTNVAGSFVLYYYFTRFYRKFEQT